MLFVHLDIIRTEFIYSICNEDFQEILLPERLDRKRSGSILCRIRMDPAIPLKLIFLSRFCFFAFI